MRSQLFSRLFGVLFTVVFCRIGVKYYFICSSLLACFLLSLRVEGLQGVRDSIENWHECSCLWVPPLQWVARWMHSTVANDDINKSVCVYMCSILAILTVASTHIILCQKGRLPKVISAQIRRNPTLELFFDDSMATRIKFELRDRWGNKLKKDDKNKGKKVNNCVNFPSLDPPKTVAFLKFIGNVWLSGAAFSFSFR
jgi:hypothetical protein